MKHKKRWLIVAAGAVGFVASCVAIYDFVSQRAGPRIVSFEPSTYEVVRGEKVILAWHVEGASRVTLDGNPVQPIGKKDWIARQPLGPHTFTLEAENRWGKAKPQFVGVQVVPRPIKIIAFDALPRTPKPADEVTMSWEISTNAERVYIEPMIGLVGRVGEQSVSVQKTTTFRITASARDVEPVSKEVTVEVQRTELEFYAEVGRIHKGEGAKLIWRTNAEFVEILPGLGTFRRPYGEKIVFPTETTTFEAVAYGPSGPEHRAISVVVLPPRPPRIRAWATTRRIRLGETALVRWQATNAERVMVEHEGRRSELLPNDQYEFSTSQEGVTQINLTATGPGGEHHAVVQVEVLPPPRSKVMVISSKFTSYGPLSQEEISSTVNSFFKSRGYEVITAPDHVRSIKQLRDRYRRTASLESGPEMPDWIADISLTMEQPIIKTPFGIRLPEQLFRLRLGVVRLELTCTATVSVFEFSSNRVIDTERFSAKKKETLQQREAYSQSNPRSKLSKEVALEALGRALENLELPR
jgi:hypothetical protein